MWTGFCELALAGGAPHRGTLLEPVHEAAIAADPEKYEWVLKELERGIAQVTKLPVRRSPVPGREIKNVVTVVAKTTHYWQEHIAGLPPAKRQVSSWPIPHVGTRQPAPLTSMTLVVGSSEAGDNRYM